MEKLCEKCQKIIITRIMNIINVLFDFMKLLIKQKKDKK